MSVITRLVTIASLLILFTIPVLGKSCNAVTWMEGGDPPVGGWSIDYPTYKSGGDHEPCTMRDGAKGDGVKAVQRALNRCSTQWQYENIPKLAVDGDYGPKTIAAIRYIQKVWKIDVDGIWGTDTGHAMYWEATQNNASGNLVKACKKKYW